VTEPADAESRIGTILDGRYLLEAVLGTGGFGAVYRARHLQLEHDVAVKLLHEGADASAAKRLTREAKVLTRLDHPNCVRIMDFGSYAGVVYLVMELVEGQPLGKLLGKPWPPRRVVDTALELLAGLAHAHALGLVHRDLKPANVLLAAGPRGGATVKIIDFGIVAIAAGEALGSFTEQLTATGRIVGTPRYMSPEQLRGTKLDARSDLYALGLIMFEMLAGRPAFDASNVRQLACMHMVAPTPLVPDDVPDELAQLVGELLAKKPEQRAASAEHVRERLLALRPTLADVRSTLKGAASESTVPERPAAEVAEVVDPIAIGPRTRVGRFSLLRELGRGAMGIVYLGWDEALDRQVAVKLLRPSPGHFHASERMVREARGLARVTHPNVVDVYELGSHEGQMFVAMQYVRGRTLRAWQREAPRSVIETLVRLCEAGRGLAAVHAAGLVHRDFKPDNVLVGDDERARVVDFGLVRAVSPAFEMIDRLAPGQEGVEVAGGRGRGRGVDPLEAKLTRTGAILGTPAYMGLEQLAGDQVDARSDQFAFCVVAWEALHGQRPFVGRSLEDLAAKLAAGHVEAPQAGSAVPRRVDEVLARGLQVMPDSRWPSMDALLDALERAGGIRGRGGRAARGLLAGVAGVSIIAAAAWALGDREAAVPSEPVGDAVVVEPEDGDQAELERAHDRVRAQLARARPEDPASLGDAIELGARHREAMPLEVRASLHAVASVTHERYALPREIDEIGALAWSPAGPVLALALKGGGIALWDADARTSLRTLVHAEPLDSLAFSRDGELLVARQGSGRAILWHVSTGVQLAEIEQAGLRQAMFLAGTQELVTASDEGVSLWGLVRGRELERARMIVEDRDVVALASAGERVSMLSSQGRVSTWTRVNDEIVRVELHGFVVHVDQPCVLASDGARIARASVAGLELWDALTGTHIATPKAEYIEHGAVVFSPDSRMLAVALRGRAPLVIDAVSGEPRVTRIAPQVETRALAFDSSGTQLFALGDDGRLEIAELASGGVVDEIIGLAAGAHALALDPTGSRLTVIAEDGLAWVWATSSVAVVRALPAGHAPEAEPLLPLAVNGDDARLGIDAEGRVAVPMKPGGDPIASLEVEGPVTAMAISHDASTIATASGAWPARVELWTREGQRTRTLELDGELRALAFSPDGKQLACAGVGPRVELRSTTDGMPLGELRTHEPEIHALAFSPDAALLAVGGREVHLWQLDASFDLATLGRARAPVQALAFSPDGRQLGIAYADGAQVLRWIDEQTLLVALCRAGSAQVDPHACE